MATKIGDTCIHKYLHMNSSTTEQYDEFIDKYLKWDGKLVLKIIAHNTNDIVMANLVAALFKLYFNEQNNHE